MKKIKKKKRRSQKSEKEKKNGKNVEGKRINLVPANAYENNSIHVRNKPKMNHKTKLVTYRRGDETFFAIQY